MVAGVPLQRQHLPSQLCDLSTRKLGRPPLAVHPSGFMAAEAHSAPQHSDVQTFETRGPRGFTQRGWREYRSGLLTFALNMMEYF